MEHLIFLHHFFHVIQVQEVYEDKSLTILCLIFLPNNFILKLSRSSVLESVGGKTQVFLAYMLLKIKKTKLN